MTTTQIKTPAPIKSVNKYFKEHTQSSIAESLSLGKTYKYSIDKSFIKPYINGDRFIFQTPMLYMPYAAKHVDSYNSGGIGFDNWHIDASFYNTEHDPDVAEFEAWLKALEYDIYKVLRKRSNLGITLGGKLSNIKNDEYRDCSKLVLKLDKQTNFFLLDAQGKIGGRIDYKTELKPPCYAVFIIEVASLWIRKNTTHLDTVDIHQQAKTSTVTWGINFIVHAAQCLPSHLSIAPIPDLKFLPVKLPQQPTHNTQSNINSFGIPPPPPPMPSQLLTITAPSFMDTYTRMLKMGIPRDAVKHKMIMAGLDPQLLDNPFPQLSHQQTVKVPLFANAELPPKITSDMLTSVKLKKAAQDIDSTKQNVKNKKTEKPVGGFEVNLDELLNIKSRLKKPKDTGLPTYSSIFKPVDM
jgi:hypothetical protein